ncbi:TonB family protein [Brevundimonas sp. A19_0]|uniref:TonB family protein n=1 Tax=Brevundimonas sp. A19_0 TaxID=2821087 RepID=UPI001ADB375C|nr:TonB family protein [Brevundimonas sp. A19_0]MBO9501571.1 TonB family protein [Brevundimonas sp. A19_0]
MITLSLLSALLVSAQDPAPAPPPVRIPIRPAALIPADPERPSIITNPRWAVRPQVTERELRMVMPALEQDISGEAAVSCRVNADGRLRDCTVIETPAGHGFGDAALSAARSGQVDVSRYTPPSESTVHFTIRFRP